MVDPESTRRLLKRMAAQVAQNIREAALRERRQFLQTADDTREFARRVRDSDDTRVPRFEFEVEQVLGEVRGVRRVERIPVDASGAIRYRSNIGEFNFTPLDGPFASNRAALNQWRAGLIGREMFGAGDNPYVPAFPFYLENGRPGVIQIRIGQQIAAPPGLGHSCELAAADFATNNVRDAHVGRPFEGLHGIRITPRGELYATDNWRTFDWKQPIAANPVVARHSGHLFDWDTHHQIAQTDPAELANKLLRTGMDNTDIAEVLERISILQQFGGIPALHRLDPGRV
jgi:hypothetical protein